MQPGIPPGGLFGPDAFIPDWGRPGYQTPPDISSPGGRFGHWGPDGRPMPEMMGLLSGLDPIAPFPIPIPNLPDTGKPDDLPGTAPSLNFPDFGIVVRRGSELIEELYAGIPRAKVKVLYPAPPPPKPSAPKDEAEEEGESKAWYERAWDWLKGAFGAIGRAFGAVGRAVANVFKYAVGYGMMGILSIAINAHKVAKFLGDIGSAIGSFFASDIISAVLSKLAQCAIGGSIGFGVGLGVSLAALLNEPGSADFQRANPNFQYPDMPENKSLQPWPPEKPKPIEPRKSSEPPRFYAYDPLFPPQPVPENDLPWFLRPEYQLVGGL